MAGTAISGKPVLEVNGICCSYSGHRILDQVTFAAEAGEIVALVGPNGSGKSTLIRAIASLLHPDQGTVAIEGTYLDDFDPVDLAMRVSYVPQYLLSINYSTVMDMVLLGRRPHITWTVPQDDLEVVQQAMDTVGISHLAEKYIDELSGGERQKVYIARALAQEAMLYLFDEPTSALDIRHQLETLETMRRILGERVRSLSLHCMTSTLRSGMQIAFLSLAGVKSGPSEVPPPFSPGMYPRVIWR
jgi:iron complex transport system ATP-binding protein